MSISDMSQTELKTNYEIEATVVLGLEGIAKHEAEVKLDAKVNEVNPGRVNFMIDSLKEVLKLKSVDNLHFIIHRLNDVKFSEDKDECMQMLKSLVEDINWKDSLEIYRNFLSEKGLPQIGDIPSYRVTCKRVGKHSFDSPLAAHNFGGSINNHIGWKVDLSKFEIEVMLMIIDNEVRVGIALTKESLHRRNIVNFGYTTLKPTIAYGMLWHCKIEPGDVVCDPLCGSGSILMESADSYPGVFNICGDMNPKLVQKTSDNWNNFAKKLNPRRSRGVDALLWDSCRLPLLRNSVDVIVTDLPFGKRVGSKKNNLDLYPKILNEFARVMRESTGRACILTQDKKGFIKGFDKVRAFWKRGPTVGINVGGILASLYILYRTPTEFKSQDDSQ